MSLLSLAKQFTTEFGADSVKDQYFLIDENVLENLMRAANITSADRVLEVGAGLGFLTKMLAARANSVLAIEIDPKFSPFLNQPSPNVEVIFGDAYQLLNSREFQRTHKSPTKTVSSIPYSQAQNMLHNYTNWQWYQGDVVWLAPLSFAKKVNSEPILGAYFNAEIVEKVPKSAFYPQPNTESAIIYLHRIDNPEQTKNFPLYWRRWLYNHEDMKVANALREGIIHSFIDIYGKAITKKQARNIVKHLDLPAPELEKLVNNISPKYYFELPEQILKIYRENKN